jgi:DUF4097 and DUF4098 domain-containing protein YvlB
MLRSWARAAAVALVAAFALPGCLLGDVALAARDGFEETRPFDEGGTFRLENVNGRVRIATWDEPRVRIQADKAAANESLLQSIEIAVEGEGDRVEVRTRLPYRLLGSSGRVDYDVTLPRQARVDVHTVNGRLSVEGITGRTEVSATNGRIEIDRVSGDVEASTVNGGIEARYDEVAPGGEHRFSTTNGAVTLELPADVTGRFEARTVNGSIRTDFPLDVTGKLGHRLEGRLGDGPGSFDVRTVNGSVRIRKR